MNHTKQVTQISSPDTLPGYDLIGDIHGHADKLKGLLLRMGYKLINGHYQHPHRQVIFLGDFIDRGPAQRDVLNIVIPMVENGSALAVMGNHEFNALALHTPDPESPSDSSSDNAERWLRPRNNKNLGQHMAFLQEYLAHGMEKELARTLEFFHTLPLWLDLDGVRVVHACWHEESIAKIKPFIDKDNRLTPAGFLAANRKGSRAFNAVEALLKGIELELPEDKFFLDKDQNKRSAVRVQWWKHKADNYGDIALPQGILDAETSQVTVKPEHLLGYPTSTKPVFFGHYWMQGTPDTISDNVACLDYSAAGNGPLVAYRWCGESKLHCQMFTYIPLAKEVL